MDTRTPMSEADIRRMERSLYPPSQYPIFPPPEGVELDIAMECQKERLRNKEWAIKQGQLLRNDLRKMRKDNEK